MDKFEKGLQKIKKGIEDKKKNGIDIKEDDILKAIIVWGASCDKIITYSQAEKIWNNLTAGEQ